IEGAVGLGRAAGLVATEREQQACVRGGWRLGAYPVEIAHRLLRAPRAVVDPRPQLPRAHSSRLGGEHAVELGLGLRVARGVEVRPGELGSRLDGETRSR